MRKRKDKDFGYFADNTLEDLRKNSYRDKSLVSTSQLLNESSSEEPVVKPKKRKSKSFEAEIEHHLGIRNTSTPIRTNQLAKSNGTISKLPKRTRIEIEEEEQMIAFSPAISFERQQMYMNYIDKGSAKDLVYQRSCAKDILEILSKNDSTAEFIKMRLVERALEAWVCGVLPKLDCPNGTKIVPIIEFNSRGEPNWTFVLSSPNNSLDIQERINHPDQELLDAFKKIYEIILPKNMDVLMNNDSIKRLENIKENIKALPYDTPKTASTVNKNVTPRNNSKVTKNVQRAIKNISSKVNSSKSMNQNEKTKSSTKKVLQNKAVKQIINRTKERSKQSTKKFAKTPITKKAIATPDSGYTSAQTPNGPRLSKNGKKIGRPKGSKNKMTEEQLIEKLMNRVSY